MIGTNRSCRTDVAIVTGAAALKADVSSRVMVAATLHGRRKAVASAEPEDAHLTGMTRSLDRRLLALNLRPAAQPAAPALKVA